MRELPSWFFHPGAVMTGWLLWLLGPGQVIGLENVPRTGSFLVVANHCSNLDPPFLGWAVGHRIGRVVHFMAKDELRRWPVIGWLARNSGAIFVRRGEGDRAAQRTAVGVLASGRPLALFPEGTRSRDGRMKEGRAGAALLAMRGGARVLPVGIAGTHRIFENGRLLPRRGRVTIRIGAPFELPLNETLDRAAMRAGTERLMSEIAALLPEEQRGRWGLPAPAAGSAESVMTEAADETAPTAAPPTYESPGD